MSPKIKKYLVGFAVFMAFYLLAENIRNRFSVVDNLTRLGLK